MDLCGKGDKKIIDQLVLNRIDEIGKVYRDMGEPICQKFLPIEATSTEPKIGVCAM